MWLGKEYISCYNTNGNKAAVNIYIRKLREVHNHLVCPISCLKQWRNYLLILVFLWVSREHWDTVAELAAESLSCETVSCKQNFPEYTIDVDSTTICKEWYVQQNAWIADLHLKNWTEVNFVSNPKYCCKFFIAIFLACFLGIKLWIDKTLQWTVKSQYVEYF